MTYFVNRLQLRVYQLQWKLIDYFHSSNQLIFFWFPGMKNLYCENRNQMNELWVATLCDSASFTTSSELNMHVRFFWTSCITIKTEWSAPLFAKATWRDVETSSYATDDKRPAALEQLHQKLYIRLEVDNNEILMRIARSKRRSIRWWYKKQRRTVSWCIKR